MGSAATVRIPFTIIDTRIGDSGSMVTTALYAIVVSAGILLLVSWRRELRKEPFLVIPAFFAGSICLVLIGCRVQATDYPSESLLRWVYGLAPLNLLWAPKFVFKGTADLLLSRFRQSTKTIEQPAPGQPATRPLSK